MPVSPTRAELRLFVIDITGNTPASDSLGGWEVTTDGATRVRASSCRRADGEPVQRCPDCITNWLRQLRGVAAGSCVRSTEEQHIGADYALPSQDVDRRLYLWHARDREPVGHPEQQDLEANHVFAGR
jgi:hypothetical protein